MRNIIELWKLFLLRAKKKGKTVFHFTDMFHFNNFSGRSGLTHLVFFPLLFFLCAVNNSNSLLLLFIIDAIISAVELL